jgi:hypothetical protein
LEEVEAKIEELGALYLQISAVALIEHYQQGNARQRDRKAQHSFLSNPPVSATSW